ncbi:MAG: PAS domain S-box protein [Chloroflexota bacterium]|nr:PAS domain S-box protein [Chloroflexota bacterium]
MTTTYQSVYLALPEAIFISSAKTGRILDCNPAAEKLVGKSKKEMVGTLQWKLHPKGKAREYRERFKTHARIQGTVRDEAELATDKGKPVYVQISTSLSTFRGKDVVVQVFTPDKRPRVATEPSTMEPIPTPLWLADQSHEGIGIVVDGVIEFANKSMGQVFGYPTEELIGMPFLEIMAARSREAAESSYTAGPMVYGEHPPREVELRDREGNTKVVELSSESTEYQGRSAVIEVSRDITELKQLEENLRVEREFSRAILENTTEGIVVTDSEGRVINCNPAFTDLLGYTAEELKGMSTLDFTAEEDKDKSIQFTRDFMDNGISTDFELSYVTKDRTKVPIQLKGSYITRENDQAPYSVAIVRGLREPQKEDTKYAIIVEESIDGIGIIQDGIIKYANRECGQMLGYSRDELIGMNFLDMTTTNSKALVSERYRHIESGERTEGTVTEIEVQRKDGDIIVIEVSGSDVQYEGRAAKAVFARDITSRIRMENDLKKHSYDLNERIKESDCLFRLSSNLGKQEVPLYDVLRNAVEIIPSGWQYPEVTCARIVLGDLEAKTSNYSDTIWKQSQDIVVNGKQIGHVEVCYLEEKPGGDEGSLLREEHRLINAIANELGVFIERRQAKSELEREKSFTETILSSIPDMVLSMNFNGEISYVNQGLLQFTNRKREDLVGKQLVEFAAGEGFLTGESLQKVVDRRIEWFQTGRPVIDLEIELHNGLGDKTITATYSTAPILSPSGENLGEVIIIHDITDRKEAEVKLLRTTNWLNAIINSATGFFISSCDTNGLITTWNKGAEMIMGYGEEDTIGKMDFTQLLTDETLSSKLPQSEVARILESGTYEGELNYRRKNGDVFPASVSVSPLKDENNSIIGMLAIVQDITARKTAEDALLREKAFTESIITNVPDMLIAINPNHELTFVNQGFAHFIGREPDDIVGTQMHQLITELNVLTLEWTAVIMERVVHRLKTGEPISGVELEMQNLQGEVIPMLYSASGIKSPTGEVLGEVVLIRDISELKQAERDLAAGKKRLEDILETMLDGVLLGDMQGNLMYVNSAVVSHTGYQKEELLGRTAMDTLLTDAESSRFISQLQRLFQGESVQVEEYRIQRKDGTTGTLAVSLAVLKDDHDIPQAIIAVERDVSERKQAEIQREMLLNELSDANLKLSQSNQNLQDFTYVASHDLREPLRKISTFGELLNDSLQGKLEESDRENLDFMIDGAKRMQRMVDDLLMYSRVSTKEASVDRVDLNQVVSDIIKLELATQIEETGAAIEIQSQLPLINADATQMHQLLQNIIGNGLKYHREGVPPRIILRTKEMPNQQIRVEVEDNGIGIPEEHREDIFIMFRRLHTRGDYEGTGIGLAVCKRIVERHGGSIGVEPALDNGTIFWFTLPIKASESQQQVA